MRKCKKVLFIFGFLFIVGMVLSIFDYSIMSSAHAFQIPGFSGGSNKIAALDKYFINLIKNIRAPLTMAVGLVAFIAGIFMEMFAINRLTKPGFSSQKGTMGGTIGMMIIGAMLISLPATINTIESSIFGRAQYQSDQSWRQGDLTYLSKKSPDDFKRNERVLRAINAAFQYIRIFGLISFVRGLYLMKAVMDGGQATMLNASLHIFGGVLAMNIAPVLRIFFKTVGV